MKIHTTLDREAGEIRVIADVTIFAYASEIGCPEEQSGRYNGAFIAEVDSVTDADSGQLIEVDETEAEYIRELAIEQIGESAT